MHNEALSIPKRCRGRWDQVRKVTQKFEIWNRLITILEFAMCYWQIWTRDFMETGKKYFPLSQLAVRTMHLTYMYYPLVRTRGTDQHQANRPPTSKMSYLASNIHGHYQAIDFQFCMTYVLTFAFATPFHFISTDFFAGWDFVDFEMERFLRISFNWIEFPLLKSLGIIIE